jgi:hypothetical protein
MNSLLNRLFYDRSHIVGSGELSIAFHSVKVDNRDVLSLIKNLACVSQGPTNEPGLNKERNYGDKTVAACEIGSKRYREFFFQFTASLGRPCQLSAILLIFLIFMSSLAHLEAVRGAWQLRRHLQRHEFLRTNF